jgi:oxygen-independent coproporphyrinogen-3 oxidase
VNSGIYIHIPFCKSRCSYCDFATDVFRSNDSVARYVRALKSEIETFSLDGAAPTVETLYFGGGTPSLLSPAQLEQIFNSLQKKFNFTEELEFTVEMNPATVSREKLLAFKSIGVNRASFGVQTFDDTALKLLARGHDSNDALDTFKLLRECGFQNVSFDLIAGLPGQTVADWETNLNKALSLEPEHLSLYLLEIHQGTPLAEQLRSKRQPEPDEELAAAMYEMMTEKVTGRGYLQYEISNFSKLGFESKHNNKYWLCEPVFGFGVSAHSSDGNAGRWSNERDTNKYVSLIENGISPVVERNSLDAQEFAGEFAFLRLRLNSGLNLRAFAERFGFDLRVRFESELERLSEAGLIDFDDGSLRLTEKGRVFSNEVFAVFV